MAPPDAPHVVMWSQPSPAPQFDISRAFDRLADQLSAVAPVQRVAGPAEARAAVLRADAQGQRPVVLVPNPVADIGSIDLAPLIPVVGWPYDRVPPQCLPAADRFIALNPHSAEAVRLAAGPAAQILEVRLPPAPIGSRGAPNLRLAVEGSVLDTAELEIEDTAIRHLRVDYRFASARWDGRPLHMSFDTGSSDRGRLVGFYGSESWGAWSRIRDPWIVLPRTVSGDVLVSLTAHGFAANRGREVRVTLGGAEGAIRLPWQHAPLQTVLHGVSRGNILQFHGLDVSNSGTTTDIRTLGIALGSLRLSRPRRRDKVVDRLRGLLPSRRRVAAKTELAADGVVFLAEVDPGNPLSDWGWLITAFCWAFRREPAATLLLWFPDAGLEEYFAELQLALHRIGEFDCRVVAFNAHLSEEERRLLLARSDVGVSVCGGEASCPGLLDLAAAGRPIVAGCHTAFEPLVEGSPFAVDWTLGPATWPLGHGPSREVCAARADFDSIQASLKRAFRAVVDSVTEPVGPLVRPSDPTDIAGFLNSAHHGSADVVA